MKTYDPKTTEDVLEIIKSAFGPIFEAVLKGELENHLGYSCNDKSEKDTKNRRNGSKSLMKSKLVVLRIFSSSRWMA